MGIKVLLNWFKVVGIIPLGLFYLYLINPFQRNYLIAYALTLFVFVKGSFVLNRVRFDAVMLFLFSASYMLFSLIDPEVYIQTTLFYGLFPLTFLFLGSYFASKVEKSEMNSFLILAGILFSFSPLISVIINLRSGGFIQLDRGIPMFWGGTSPVKATLMGGYFTFNMCLLSIIMSSSSMKLLKKLLLGLVFVLSLLCVFRLGSRTQVAISLFVSVISLLFVIPKQSMNSNLRLFLMLGSLAILVYLYVPMGSDAEYLSTLGHRLQKSDNTGSAGGRSELWMMSLEYLVKEPFGWDKSEFGHSHNFWLDVGRAYGFLPLILLLIFSYRSIIITRTFIKTTKDIALKNTAFVFILASNLMFFVEPIVEGLFTFFLMYCFIIGFMLETNTENELSR